MDSSSAHDSTADSSSTSSVSGSHCADLNALTDQGGGNQSRPMAIVLAAGKGTRMKSDLPKVLVTACGRPIITYVLDSLRKSGVGRITIVVGYRQELVREALKDYPELDFIEQTQQLGTGHAVMCCQPTLEQQTGPVVVVAGDSPMLQSDSVSHLLDKMVSSKLACLLGTLHSPDPTGLGRIVRDDGKFVGIVEEKDATDEQRKITEVNMSTYVFDGPKLFEVLHKIDNKNKQNEFYLTDYPSVLLHRGETVDALPILKDVEALSINTVEHLAAVEEAMKKLNL